MSPTAAAEFDQVSKTYSTGLLRRRAVQALQGVSFAVPSGEVFGLLGPNRAGKTTLVKVLLALCRPTSGRALRLGRPAGHRATLARVGYVHEHQAFPRYWDPAGLLHYYGALSLLPESAVRERVPRLLERVGLADRARDPIASLSKGMVQRLGLAQALLTDPELLVLDEPTEGLDLEGRQLVRDAVAERRGRGRAVLLVSHVLAEVEALCDRVAVLVGGRLAFTGRLTDLKRGPAGAPPRPLADVLRELYQKAGP